MAAKGSSQDRERVEHQLAVSNQALALVRAPDVGIVDLLPSDAGSASSASVFWDGGLRNCYLHARALPLIAAAERYALWVEYEGGEILRVSDFRVDRRGDAEFYEALPTGTGQIIRTFVSRESRAAADRPSEAIVLSELRVEGKEGQGSNQRRKYRRRSL